MATRIPITKEKFGFEENRSKIWEDMERDMESRRREWEDEIGKMSSDFFTIRPETDRKFNTLSDKFGSIADRGVRSEGKPVIEKDDRGNTVFRVRFDVSDYKPDEVNVKMDNNKMQVQARHESKDGGKSVSREFSREINIPREIDPMSLQCAISKEGVLCVEAPYPTPQYSINSGPQTAPNIPQTQFQTSVSVAPKYQSQPPPPPSQPPYQAPSYAPPSYQPPQQQQPTHVPSYQPPPPPLSVHQELPNPVFQHHQQHQPFQNMQAPPGAPIQSAGFQQFPSSIGTPSRIATGAVGSPIPIQKDSKFKVEIDIEDFSPEELTVKTLDKKVVVSGRREIKEANRSSSKELSREYNIPDTVDPLSVKAFFTDGGRLIVEAPYKSTTNGSFTH